MYIFFEEDLIYLICIQYQNCFNFLEDILFSFTKSFS